MKQPGGDPPPPSGTTSAKGGAGVIRGSNNGNKPNMDSARPNDITVKPGVSGAKYQPRHTSMSAASYRSVASPVNEDTRVSPTPSKRERAAGRAGNIDIPQTDVPPKGGGSSLSKNQVLGNTSNNNNNNNNNSGGGSGKTNRSPSLAGGLEEEKDSGSSSKGYGSERKQVVMGRGGIPLNAGQEHLNTFAKSGISLPHSGPTLGDLNMKSWSDRLKLSINRIVDGKLVTGIMAIMTIYALYGDDVRLYGTPPSADFTFMIISSLAFFLFILEMLASCYAKPGYFPMDHWSKENVQVNMNWRGFYHLLAIGSFFFWLDLIATATLIFDIDWIYDDSESNSMDGSDNGLASARAGRASRAGARAGRVVRIVRMVRLVRLVKLYKYMKAASPGAGHDPATATESRKTLARSNTGVVRNMHLSRPVMPEVDGSSAGEVGHGHGRRASSVPSYNSDDEEGVDDDDDYNIDDLPPQSRVGALMSDLTTKRVIVGVLAMLVVIPLLLLDDPDFSKLFGIEMVWEFAANNNWQVYPNGGHALNTSIGTFLNLTSGILSLTINGTKFYEMDPYPDRRNEELLILTLEDRNIELANASLPDLSYFHMKAVMDYKNITSETAVLGILLTTFVIALLAVGTLVFTKDVNRLVILPIEAMVQLVKKISDDPLGFNFNMKTTFQEGLETTLLLQTITKIAGLMRVGFGEAGAPIIARNLQASDNSSLNLLLAGTKIHSIFGFCDIRQFTDTTECLQEEVMLFVNKIADIIHEVVAQCQGAANKNIGDAFLLTWKIEETWDRGQQMDIADQALYSFIRSTAEMGKYQSFVCAFSSNAAARLYERMPGYKVRMGFGLHYGWAIEGAIGSDKKIDASYLSPHVNMSEFLESSTKQYGIPLLMSEAFFSLMSEEAQYHCRKVDRIKRSKVEDPFCMYTYDMDLEAPLWEVMHPPIEEVAAVVPSHLLPTRSTRGLSNASSKSKVEQEPGGSPSSKTRGGGQKQDRSHLALQLGNTTNSGPGGLSEAQAQEHFGNPDVYAVVGGAKRSTPRNAGGAGSHPHSPSQQGQGQGGTSSAPSSPRARQLWGRAASAMISHQNSASVISPVVRNRLISKDKSPQMVGGHNVRDQELSFTMELHGRMVRRESLSLIRDTILPSPTPKNQRVPSGKLQREPTSKLATARTRASSGKNEGGGGGDRPKDMILEQFLQAGERRRAQLVRSHLSRGPQGLNEQPEIELEPYTRSVWTEDPILVVLQHKITEEFRSAWRNAIDSYISGDWELALKNLFVAFKLSNSEDGPTQYLLKQINKHGGKCPDGWLGYDDLSADGGH